MEYDEDVVVRQVRHNGEIKWQGGLLYVSETLARSAVGLKQIDHNQWELCYRFHTLGILDEKTGKIVPARGWHGR